MGRIAEMGRGIGARGVKGRVRGEQKVGNEPNIKAETNGETK
jgi:hypothetical protein